MIVKFRNIFLILFLELNELLINFYEYFRSLLSIKSYFLIFNKHISKLLEFNRNNLLNNTKNNNYILIDIFFDYSWIISNSIISAKYAKDHNLNNSNSLTDLLSLNEFLLRRLNS